MSWVRKGKFPALPQRRNLSIFTRQVLDVRIGECSRSVKTPNGFVEEQRKAYSNGINKPQYFHPSRPDFLPNTSNLSTISQLQEESQEDGGNHISNTILSDYLPPESWNIDMSHNIIQENESLNNLYVSIKSRDLPAIWTEFLQLKNNSTFLSADEDLKENLFDSIFWSISSEELIDENQEADKDPTNRYQDLFEKMILLTKQAEVWNVELTSLQIRRVVHLWLKCCETIQENADFSYIAFIDEINKIYEDLDGSLFSRFVSQLASKDKIEEVKKALKRWKDVNHQPETRRKERWKGADLGISIENPKLEMIINKEALMDILEACLRHPLKESSTEVAILVFSRKGTIRGNSTILRALPQFLSSNNLLSLLPKKVRHSVFGGVISNDPKIEPLHQLDEEERQKMFIPIAIGLIRSGDFRLAEWLLQMQKKVGPQSMPKGIEKVFKNATVDLARKSRNMEEKNVIQLIRRAIRFLDACRDSSPDFDADTHLTVIRSLTHIIRTRANHRSLSNDEWRTMVREVTVISLRDDECFSTDSVFIRMGIPSLLSLHIKVQDYTYAKRLFTIYQDHYGRYTNQSPFSRKGYIWLLEESLRTDASIDFAMKLFDHWLISDLSSEQRMPEFLPSHLRLLAKKLILEKRGEEVFALLHLFDFQSKPSKLTVKQMYKKSEARRTVVAFSQVPTRYFIEFVPFLENLLKYLRDYQKGEIDEHLIDMHLIVLHRYRFILREGQINALLRAQLMSIFQCMRQHALEVINAASVIEIRERSDNLRSSLTLLYKRGLRLLGDTLAACTDEEEQGEEDDYRPQQDQEIRLAKELDSVLKEMETKWAIDLNVIDLDGTNSVITSSKIHMLLGMGNWQEAHKLFCKVTQDSSNEWQEFEQIDQSQDQDRTKIPRAPLSYHVAIRLALALGKVDQFHLAREVLSVYQRCIILWTPQIPQSQEDDSENSNLEHNEDSVIETLTNVRDIKDELRLLIECTNVALLCLQDRMQEALDKIYSLERLGVFGSRPQNFTPLLFSEQGETKFSLVESTSFDFTQKVGPSNVELSEIFIKAIQNVSAKVSIADWQGMLQKAQELLAKHTGYQNKTQQEKEEEKQFMVKPNLKRFDSLITLGDRGDDSKYTNDNE